MGFPFECDKESERRGEKRMGEKMQSKKNKIRNRFFDKVDRVYKVREFDR
jgi:hypothetical protein